MKNIITTFLLLMVFFSFCSQTKDKIAGIKAKYQQINQNVKTFSKKIEDDDDQSTDGGTVTAYYKGKQLQLIRTEYLGESGKLTIDYYFDGGILVFVINKDFDYNRPYYWDKKMAKENNDTEWYDYKKTKMKIDRYYFDNGKLIKWINNKNKEISVETPDFLKQESGVLLEVKRLKKLLNA